MCVVVVLMFSRLKQALRDQDYAPHICKRYFTQISQLNILVYSAYLEILAVIKFGNLPEIWQKCIIGRI